MSFTFYVYQLKSFCQTFNMLVNPAGYPKNMFVLKQLQLRASVHFITGNFLTLNDSSLCNAG